ncbi:hypothetical protein G6M84_10205 [Agrobacterium tumefaciens]|uniref:hypothetical protein n=1 Tax=Agrobacterium tumefaciens TaxID=358 RepID=UPI001572A0CC|nr:hypothetical protein [Agrobacterium tumefaciens]NTB96889.1 hypothetical protein [Agrobacterium tumefaciens]NTC44197.1 hypothetical protein [Agrobacterium tumefaciens]
MTAATSAANRKQRRPTLRVRDVAATLEALKKSGLIPTALDTLPDGTFRWHFTPPAQNDEDDLDRELEEFDKKHGYS